MIELDNSKTRIIFNGDDFGYSQGVNRGIREVIYNGIVRSTSVMVGRQAAHEAVKLVKIPDISVGLHLDMVGEGLSGKLALIELMAIPPRKVAQRVQDQIAMFEDITGQEPHFIDSHMGVHQIVPSAKHAVRDYADEHDIPVRGRDAKFSMQFFGRSMLHSYNPNKISPEGLINTVEALGPGTYEFMTHPAYPDIELAASGTTYLEQRAIERHTLTDPRVREFFANSPDIQLASWHDVHQA